MNYISVHCNAIYVGGIASVYAYQRLKIEVGRALNRYTGGIAPVGTQELEVQRLTDIVNRIRYELCHKAITQQILHSVITEIKTQLIYMLQCGYLRNRDCCNITLGTLGPMYNIQFYVDNGRIKYCVMDLSE